MVRYREHVDTATVKLGWNSTSFMGFPYEIRRGFISVSKFQLSSKVCTEDLIFTIRTEAAENVNL